MLRLAIASVLCALCVLCAACPAKKSGEGPITSGPALPAKRIVLSWGITQEGELSTIFLATTDETGKQVSHQVGTYKGKCERSTPAKEMNALTGVACVTGGGGTELHAVRRGGEIVVVQMGTMPGVAPDPMAREEVKRVQIPVGVGVEVAP